MILAIDLGATNVKAARFDNNLNKISDTLSVPTRASEGRRGIVAALDRAVELAGGGAQYLAVSSAGDINADKAEIIYATENLPEMTGFSYTEYANRHNLTAYAVNDAQAALLGEVYCGAAKGRGYKKIAMLTLGSGVGGAYYADGKLISTPANDFARFGHIVLHEGGNLCTCGKRGCAETYLSGRALHAAAQRLGIDGGDIFLRYAAGEEPYGKLIKSFKSNLTLALEKVYKISPFEVCIIGGGVADWMGAEFNKIVMNTGYPLIKAVLGNDAGVYGACVHARLKRGEL